ncbi:MAG: hypothetical protein MZV63_61670 [Marinilabiliales bacterium]|nr:hypothetical protein [Marinilabiliales bacterium]
MTRAAEEAVQAAARLPRDCRQFPDTCLCRRMARAYKGILATTPGSWI